MCILLILRYVESAKIQDELVTPLDSAYTLFTRSNKVCTTMYYLILREIHNIMSEHVKSIGLYEFRFC